jgi:hypothetical protein
MEQIQNPVQRCIRWFEEEMVVKTTIFGPKSFIEKLPRIFIFDCEVASSDSFAFFGLLSAKIVSTTISLDLIIFPPK